MPATTEKVQSKKWADDSDDEDAVGTVTESFEDGIKTVTEIKTNDKGQKVKVVRKIKVYTRTVIKNKNIDARKKWKKFGECANAGPGLESGITSVSTDDFYLSLGGVQTDEAPVKEAVSQTAVCRNCGKVGDHWTTKCPLKPLTGGADKDMAESEDKPTKGSKYVPPSLRGGGAASTGDDSGSHRSRVLTKHSGDDFPTVRVTNLSEDTRESDLAELFRPFGPISRIYLAKDKDSNVSRGFAFVSFMRHDDARRAIEKLSGHGYDHLILHLEWAKPSK